MRLSLAPLSVVIALTAACKTETPSSQVMEEQAAMPIDQTPSAAQPNKAAPPTADGHISLNGILARNGMYKVRFVPAPLVRQARNFTCGAAALESVLMYWGDELREGQLQTLLKSDPATGTSYSEMVALVNTLNDKNGRTKLATTLASDELATKPLSAGSDNHGVLVHRQPIQLGSGRYTVELHPGKEKQTRRASDTGEVGVPKDGLSTKELEEEIDKGHPVILLIQAWSGKGAAGWADDASDGHYVVAVGYDKDNIFFMDPATAGNYAFIPRKELLDRWHDRDTRVANGAKIGEPVRHFGLVIYRDKPGFDLDNVLKLD